MPLGWKHLVLEPYTAQLFPKGAGVSSARAPRLSYWRKLVSSVPPKSVAKS